MLLLVLLLTPLFAALLLELFQLWPGQRLGLLRLLHGGAALITFGLSCGLGLLVWRTGTLSALGGLLRADLLAALLALLLSGLGLLAALGAASADGWPAGVAVPAPHSVRPGLLAWFTGGQRVYALLQLVLFALLLAITSDDVGLLWVASAGASLLLALLLLATGCTPALPTYLLLLLPGFALALLGTLLLLLAGAGETLRWSALLAAPTLDGRVLRLAGLLALLGYGALAGLAPLHGWLPGTLGLAPPPLAVLLGAAQPCVGLYALIRVQALADLALGAAFSQRLLLGLGLLTLLLAALALPLQRDYRHLLAYLGMAQIGFICLGLAVGGFWGTLGALVQLLNYALSAAVLLLLAGRIVLVYGSSEMAAVRGLLYAQPLLGCLLLLATLALAGVPPFAAFASTLLIASAGMQAAAWAILPGVALLACVALVTLLRSGSMLFGPAPTVVAVSTGEEL